MDGESPVKIFGEEFSVKCTVESIDCFSAHADRHELLQYLSQCPPEKMKKVFLIHGEEESISSFSNALKSKGYLDLAVPQRGETFTI